MAAETILPLRDWVEPAHPTLVQLHDDLVTLYTHIKQVYQPGVDQAFDDVSRQIGYVVTTTVPIVLRISDRTAPFDVQMGSESLKGTLFEMRSGWHSTHNHCHQGPRSSAFRRAPTSCI